LSNQEEKEKEEEEEEKGQDPGRSLVGLQEIKIEKTKKNL
jgi:hypothetical protein